MAFDLTSPVRLAVSAAILLCLGCCDGEPDTKPAVPWKISDFQVFSDDSGCCPPPVFATIGIMAATDWAMPGNSAKIAIGCRKEGDGAELGAVVALKVSDELGRTESFEGMNLTMAGNCDDAGMSWAFATYMALREPSEVWHVTTMDDAGLCRLLAGENGRRDVVLRAMEEAGARKTCAPEVAGLSGSQDADIALRAVGTLGRIGATASIKMLGSLTLSDSPLVPWAAAQAIADIGGPEAVRALDIVAGQASTGELRREAARLSEKIRRTIGAR